LARLPIILQLVVVFLNNSTRNRLAGTPTSKCYEASRISVCKAARSFSSYFSFYSSPFFLEIAMIRYSNYVLAALLVVAICVMFVPLSQVTAAIFNGDTIRVYGMDSTPEGAQENAYENMTDAIIGLIIDLEPGEVIVDVVIEDEHFVLPTLYVIDFHVVYDDGNGGGGVGSGNPGGGGPN
jgi:hypothetical protein